MMTLLYLKLNVFRYWLTCCWTLAVMDVNMNVKLCVWQIISWLESPSPQTGLVCLITESWCVCVCCVCCANSVCVLLLWSFIIISESWRSGTGVWGDMSNTDPPATQFNTLLLVTCSLSLSLSRSWPHMMSCCCILRSDEASPPQFPFTHSVWNTAPHPHTLHRVSSHTLTHTLHCIRTQSSGQVRQLQGCSSYSGVTW